MSEAIAAAAKSSSGASKGVLRTRSSPDRRVSQTPTSTVARASASSRPWLIVRPLNAPSWMTDGAAPSTA